MATEVPNRPGRPKGAKDKHPRNNKVTEPMSDAEMVAVKKKIIELFDDRKIDNLSQAGNFLGISKMRLYRWKGTDPEWAKLLAQADELIADELEEELKYVKNVPETTAKIFRLKKIRPAYRDTWKMEVTDSRVLEHLEELRKLAKQEPKKDSAENK